MIYIATVHWKDERWVDIQLRYLHQHFCEPFRIFAWLNDVPGDHRKKYYHVVSEPVTDHAVKLNLLAEMISFDSSRDEDLIVFLDGDAFPIGDVIGFAREKLEKYRLIAVQRRENNGDIQPHPCFAVTTVGFWKEIQGDWKDGHRWLDAGGKPTTDVGGNLLGILERHRVPWLPMLRSNRREAHPLFFAVYGNLVYHHGASFRPPGSRLELCRFMNEARKTWQWPIIYSIEKLTKLSPRLGYRLQFVSPVRRFALRIVQKNQAMSDCIFANIVRNLDFWKEFVEEQTTSIAPPQIRAEINPC